MNSEESQTFEPEKEQETSTEITDDMQSPIELEGEESTHEPEVVEAQLEAPQEEETEIPEREEETQKPVLEAVEVKEETPVKEEETSEPVLEAETVTEETETKSDTSEAVPLRQEVSQLQQQKDFLLSEIDSLQAQQKQIAAQTASMQANLGQMVEAGLQELQQRQQALQASIEQLERRRDRIRQEMRTTFAGASQELAIRVQGFKDYLTGSLEDLVAAAQQLDIPTDNNWETSPPSREEQREVPVETSTPQFTKQAFQEQTRQIRQIIDQYRTLPDYYGPPWQLRRTFEPVHAEKVESWFFTQGGRGAIPSLGSRLQNILVASAIISVLRQLYGDRLRTLVLANTPERLGEWRRGLQDCLGISRIDFGPERGVVLFETPEAAAQKADRLLQERELPLIVMDATDDMVNLALLQFPLWLAFAPDPQSTSSYLY